MKMLLATVLALAYYRMCSTDVYCSKQTGSSSTKGNHHPSFLRFWNWAEENCRCSQNLWRRRNVVKTETQQTFVNGLLGFITLGIYTPLKRVCIAHNNCMSCPSIRATLSALLINILLGSFQLFLVCGSAFSEGEIIPFSGVCQSGRLHYPRRRRWWLHASWLTDRFDVQPTTTSGNIITQSITFSFSIRLTPSCILHRAQQHHADASACQ